MISPYNQYFSEIDKKRALKIAGKFWYKVDTQKQDIIKKLIETIFNIWKYENGEVRTLAGLLGHPIEKDSDRWIEYIDNHDAWDCVPIWIDNNPLDLYIHIWASGYQELDAKTFLEGLSWLVIFCIEKNNNYWLPAIMRSALFLAELKNDNLESSARYLFDEAKINSKKVAVYYKNKKNLNQYSPAEKQRVAQLQQEIHNMATTYLQEGKQPKNIPRWIAEKKIFKGARKIEDGDDHQPIGERQIKRYLKTHPTGYWKPNTKKRKALKKV